MAKKKNKPKRKKKDASNQTDDTKKRSCCKKRKSKCARCLARCTACICKCFWKAIRKCCGKCLKKNVNYIIPSKYKIDEPIRYIKDTLDTTPSVFNIKGKLTEMTSMINLDSLNGLSATDLKKKFSFIKGSKSSVLNKILKQNNSELLGLNTPEKKEKLDKLSKTKLNDLLVKFGKSQKLSNLNIDELKNKFSFIGTKQTDFEEMLGDFKKGNLSATKIIGDKKIDIRKVKKSQVSDMIIKYKEIKMNKAKKVRDDNAEDLKKKFSFRRSKRRVFEQMLDDYTQGKVSVTELASNKNIDMKKLKKSQLNNIISRYKKTKMPKDEQEKEKIHNFMETFSLDKLYVGKKKWYK